MGDLGEKCHHVYKQLSRDPEKNHIDQSLLTDESLANRFKCYYPR